MTNDTHRPQFGDKITVWFSCGAASAVAAKMTVQRYDNLCEIEIINNPVAEEDQDNRRFFNDVQAWISKPIKIIGNPAYPDNSAESVWRDRKAMSFPKGAPCTLALKKEVRYAYEAFNMPDWYVFGYTTSEEHRDARRRVENPILPLLIDAGLSKDDCFKIVKDAGIALPRTYAEASRFGSGYPNANCIGCVKATSPTYWNHVRETRPEVFEARANLSRELGVRLVRVKGKRIFLDELDPDERGRDMKTMKVDCGILCEVPNGR